MTLMNRLVPLYTVAAVAVMVAIMTGLIVVM